MIKQTAARLHARQGRVVHFQNIHMLSNQPASGAKCNTPEGVDRPSASVIWERFPKFVLGFMLASVLFSFVVAPDVVAETGSLMKGLRTWWFPLAFVCIGLETRFAELFGMDDGRPALAFIGAQAINVVWTLLIAYLVFGGIVFPAPQL